jgi:hypothetical protein
MKMVVLNSLSSLPVLFVFGYEDGSAEFSVLLTCTLCVWLFTPIGSVFNGVWEPRFLSGPGKLFS